ncbi:hypothetical protein BGX38DRAFT_793022 [Terfezia claveryi]|nr:hypothetical protein BGX38DRAFT_793022 [Terfezia claveryi]
MFSFQSHCFYTEEGEVGSLITPGAINYFLLFVRLSLIHFLRSSSTFSCKYTFIYSIYQCFVFYESFIGGSKSWLPLHPSPYLHFP